MQDLSNFNSEKLFSSLYLAEQVNLFRQKEGNKKELLHKTLLAKIEKRFQSKIIEQKILPVEYKDKKGENRKMYELPFEYCLRILMDESELVQDACIEVMKAQQKEINQLKSPQSDYHQLEQHTQRPTQLQSSKVANSFAFKRLNGKQDAIDWNRKVTFTLTGKTPSELKDIAKKHNLPSKYRTSGKEVVRYYKPEVAGAISLADWLHANGETDDKALSLSKMAIPVLEAINKHTQIQQAQ